MSDSKTLLRKADSALLRSMHMCMCVHVAAVITPRLPLTSPPLYPLLPSLSFRLYLCSTSLAHSSLRWLWRHTLSAFPPGCWLCSSITLCLLCALLPLQPMSPPVGIASQPASLAAAAGALELTQNCYAATALSRFSSLPFASHSFA